MRNKTLVFFNLTKFLVFESLCKIQNIFKMETLSFALLLKGIWEWQDAF